ncbi:MAG: cytochrome P450 [Acidimicrobiales bacterium]|nr:cytochrome P450 [Acidimicrobiales bacterium]
MTVTTGSDVYYDPYDIDINADPYPTYARLRAEAPLYYNEPHDFWAVSRAEDVEKGLVDRDTFISGRGGILEIIKADMEMPPGLVIFEDPPTHTIHRSLMARMFTPKKVSALEPQVRELCARCMDPLVGSDGFDVVAEIGRVVPMQVISMLLGIPEEDQEAVRARSDDHLRTEAGKPMEIDENFIEPEHFGEYIDWRAEHPSDDIMTEMLHVEFEDEHGVRRRLTREELTTYLTVVAGAGNETTTKLIGWFTKVLGDHPDQRAEVVADRELVPNAIEEVLRFEPTGPAVGRYVAKEVEIHGRTVPAGSAMLMLVGSANRDDRRFPDPDRFDIHRSTAGHLTFGYGAHFCLGAALARLEGRVVLDEMLKRWPEWEVDLDGAHLAPTSTVRGYETLPIRVP